MRNKVSWQPHCCDIIDHVTRARGTFQMVLKPPILNKSATIPRYVVDVVVNYFKSAIKVFSLKSTQMKTGLKISKYFSFSAFSS